MYLFSHGPPKRIPFQYQSYRIYRTVGLEDSENLVTYTKYVSNQFPPTKFDLGAQERNRHTSNNLNLCDTVRISENDTDLRWGSTLLCELADLVNNLLWGGLEPCWRSARVWDGGCRYTLSVAVKTTHDD